MRRSHQFGFVTLLGAPNVGKSTLLNQLIGQKISITSHRPQTTRHRILGIHSEPQRQIVFVDTPGVHSVQKKANRKVINRVINKTALASVDGVDVVCLLITAQGWTDADTQVIRALQNCSAPVVLLINKVDKLDSINRVLPIIQQSSELYDFAEIVPISAAGQGKHDNLDHLLNVIQGYLPSAAPGFENHQITDRSFRFLVAELIREQLFRRLGDELPYATAVELNEFKKVEGRYQIGADIWVEKTSHKAMVIGKQGKALKNIGIAARKNCESLLEAGVHLQLFVKVRSGWSDNTRDLFMLGYDEDRL